MFKARIFARTVALAGALPLLLASSAFAQNRVYPRSYEDRDNATRTVDGTIASVTPTRDGDGVRLQLTNGMELFAPSSLSTVNDGRRYQATTLQPGDVVRMDVFSRESDGRDARVRSFALLQQGNYDRDGSAERRLTGTVLSFDRRNDVLVLQTDEGRMLNVSFRSYQRRFHRGERVSVSGRMDRDRGTFVADWGRVTD